MNDIKEECQIWIILIIQQIVKKEISFDKMSYTSRRPTLPIDSRTLLLYQINQIKMKHAKPKSLPKKISDPVHTQLYIHHMGDYGRLPPIKQTIAIDTLRNNSQQKSERIKNMTDIKSRRCETIPCDFQCSEKFITQNANRRLILSKEEAKGKKFVEIDILTLETYYAKNVDGKIIEKVGGHDGVKKQLTSIPSKQAIADFIKTYKVKNDKLNVDDMVRSPLFAVQFTEKSSLYFGDVREGQLDGKGIMITKNWIFQGEWCKSQKIQGVEVTTKGIYKGKYVRNQRSKVGQFFWSNGQYYSGEWYKNKKHGTGVWKSVKGDVYMGQWNKGKVQGYGIHLSKGGQKYEGFFINFLKDGQGKQYFPNGDYFEGIFKMGKPQGFGVYKWKNGITYEGQFKSGLRQGKGKIYKVGVEYEGTFVRQKADGQGRLVVFNGSNYIGQFKKGKKQGKGISKEKRTVFIGTWQNNKFIQKHI